MITPPCRHSYQKLIGTSTLLSRLILIALLALLLLTVIRCACQFYHPRFFWLDEAMLARSVISRSFATLVTSPLDFGQSAPIGWLYFVKIFGVCGGYSEQSLRLFSYVSYLGCIAIIIAWCYEKSRSWSYALFFACFFASSPFYLRYANECKPYMSDNFWVIFTLFTYCLYRRGRVKEILMVAQFLTACLMSFPAVFAVATCLICDFITLINSLKRKKYVAWRPRVTRFGIISAPVCAFLLLLYILWIAPASRNAGNPEYWKLLSFPVISTKEPMATYWMLTHIFAPVKNNLHLLSYIVLVLALTANLLLCFVRGYIISAKVVLPLSCIALVLIASSCGYYPIQDRLVQFIPLLMLLSAAHALILLLEEHRLVANAFFVNLLRVSYLGVLIAICVPQGENIKRLLRGVAHSEVKTSFLDLYSKQFDKADMLFVNKTGVPLLDYLTSYPSGFSKWDRVSHQRGKVFYGPRLNLYYFQIPYSYDAEIDEKAYWESVNAIKDSTTALLFFSHESDDIILEDLKKFGVIKPVYDNQGIRMYTYSCNALKEGA